MEPQCLTNHSGFSPSDDLLAYIIGDSVLTCLKTDITFEKLLERTELKAVRILEEIQAVLNDPSLGDPECCRRVRTIVDVFVNNYLFTTRVNTPEFQK